MLNLGFNHKLPTYSKRKKYLILIAIAILSMILMGYLYAADAPNIPSGPAAISGLANTVNGSDTSDTENSDNTVINYELPIENTSLDNTSQRTVNPSVNHNQGSPNNSHN